MLKAEKSVAVAKAKLDEAKGLAGKGFLDMAFLSAYVSMFHSGRALLFRDGLIEKSHHCLILYLNEHYVKNGKIPHGFITLLDAFRNERHMLLYGLDPVRVRRRDLDEALNSAEEFIPLVEKLLKE